ncbi:hypothetical protein BGW36DRAFT_382705 [Talaromyces proteolyticus]|uniref:Uncharacterized protein n=1 Tax=Talaromyces proteolyticus TaxID=1131652 RepID=A0AAD4PZ95_9EURO|nr:uncharacterized protein BGW36DRAFT_382705 [Talaromyces proteolyticus]KAH8695444.1 hypothetical protein BGW36DRAFT_382705 [Talaromyces proteolyticus]
MADNNIVDRLRSVAFDLGEARNALRGKAVPTALGRRLTRLCIICGIRYHEQFAENPDLEQLSHYVPEVLRALNARAIMSNKIPSMPEARDRPYCIWYPQVASQDTYRKLWQQYPDMSYQVARACAVANYVELYLEMDLLPDTSVAEEARASGSMEIYEAIMRNPVQYRIMNDYTREITVQNPNPACLNDDTAIVSYLDVKQRVRHTGGIEEEPILENTEQPQQAADDDDDMGFLFPFPGFDEQIFNITEDMNVGEVDWKDELYAEGPPIDYLPELLSQPLPVHLPQGNKDLLILMAAYYGNIERYARLRRPRMIDKELGCLVRGIYHNSMFALWCASQTMEDYAASHVKTAIHARMIMNNDLSRIINLDTRQPSRDFFCAMPYLIWFPTVANRGTYKLLATTVPEMRPSVLHAAVFAQDKALFDWMLDVLHVAPTPFAFREAAIQLTGEVHSSYFRRRLEARSQELGIDLLAPMQSWKFYSARSGQQIPPSNWLAKKVMPLQVTSEQSDWGIYNGFYVDASSVELFASAPESWRPDKWQVEIDYQDWPKSGSTHE